MPSARATQAEEGGLPTGPDLKREFEAIVGEFYKSGPAGFLGNTIKISKFESTLKRAVDAGCGDVTHAEADFVLEGLRNGFDLGVDHS